MTAAGRRAAVLAVLPLVVTITGCGPAPVSPLATRATNRPGVAVADIPAVTAAPSVTKSPARAAAPRNPPPRPNTTTIIQTTSVRPPTSVPTSAGPCRGVEQYELDLRNNELALIRPMCFRVGSVLRLQGIGPGLVTAEPDTVASQFYEAGVVDIHLIRPGTATVTIPQNDQVHTITVVVRS